MKKDFLTYKNFISSIHFSADDEIFYGKIEGITDLISFEGNSVVAIKKAFRKPLLNMKLFVMHRTNPYLNHSKGHLMFE